MKDADLAAEVAAIEQERAGGGTATGALGGAAVLHRAGLITWRARRLLAGTRAFCVSRSRCHGNSVAGDTSLANDQAPLADE